MATTATDPIPGPGVYRRVTLATDGSVDAQAAVSAVAGLAWPAETVISVVGVVTAEPPLVAGSLPPDGAEQEVRAYLEAQFQDARSRVAEHVSAVAATLRRSDSGPAIEEVVRNGRAADEILAQAKEDGADLVVAGAKGHGMLGALMLGSVSEALVERSPCPVLIVRGGAWEAAARVLVAVGPDDDPERLGDAVLRLPLPAGSRVVVASVGNNAGNGPVLQADRLAAHLTARAPGLAAESRALTGNVADELLRAAAAIPADLIVAGARARRGLRAHLGLGSVSRALVRRAGCSVLVVRPGSDGATG